MAEAFTPLLAALDGFDIDVRAIDVRRTKPGAAPSGAARQAPSSPSVGDPDLLRAQMGGLALAAERSGYRSTPRLVVRHVSDPIEARRHPPAR